jgi:outer membrane protein assembly factor BamA
VVRVIEIRDDPGTPVIEEDTLTSASGGNDLLFANAELRFPLPGVAGRLEGALFVDAGQVRVRGQDAFRYDGLRVTPGIGLRLRTGIGPIRLDVGYNGYRPQTGPLYRRVDTRLDLEAESFTPDEPTSFFNRIRLHISVGQAF